MYDERLPEIRSKLVRTMYGLVLYTATVASFFSSPSTINVKIMIIEPYKYVVLLKLRNYFFYPFYKFYVKFCFLKANQ